MRRPGFEPGTPRVKAKGSDQTELAALVPRQGFEPWTYRVRVGSSDQTELARRDEVVTVARGGIEPPYPGLQSGALPTELTSRATGRIRTVDHSLTRRTLWPD